MTDPHTDATVDLSHPLETGMPVYPGTDPVRIEPASTVAEDGYRTTRLDVDSHAGTHVDAPAHLLADGRTLEAYPIGTFRFEATVADCRPLEARESIDAEALRAAVPASVARDGGDEIDADLLVVRTGWEDTWGSDRYFDHPYLTADAASWLAARDLHLGLDTLNPDPTPTENAGPGEPEGFPVHRTLFERERLLLENLRGLEAVADRETFELCAYPLALGEVDASPVRAVAVLE